LNFVLAGNLQQAARWIHTRADRWHLQ